MKGKGEQIDLETGEIGVHSTPAIIKDVMILGAAMSEGATVSTHNNTRDSCARSTSARQAAVDVQHHSAAG